MARVVLFKLPDWATLEQAGAAFEVTRSEEARAHLEATLLTFVERADLLATYVSCVNARPSLS